MSDEFDLDEMGEPAPLTPADIVLTQPTLIGTLTQLPQLALALRPYLDPDLFAVEYQPVMRFFVDYLDQHRTPPSIEMLYVESGRDFLTLSDLDQPQVRKYVEEKWLKWLRAETAGVLLIEASETLNSDMDAGLELIRVGISRVEQITLDSSANTLRVYKDFERFIEAEKVERTPVGYEVLDRTLGGGTARPSYNLLTAPSGYGKSTVLQNFALNYSQKGFNVVFYSLEMDKRSLMERWLPMISEIDMSMIESMKYKVVNRFETARLTRGEILVVDWSDRSASVSEIASHYSGLCHSSGKEWSVVIIDHLNHLRVDDATIRSDNIHMRDEKIAQAIKLFAYDKQRPKIVWAAAQQVKGADKLKETGQGTVSGGAGRVQWADNLINMMAPVEIEFYGKVVRWQIKKARHSPGAMDKFVAFQFDAATYRVTEAPQGATDFLNEMDQEKPEPKKSKAKQDPVVAAAAMKQRTEAAGGVSARIEQLRNPRA